MIARLVQTFDTIYAQRMSPKMQNRWGNAVVPTNAALPLAPVAAAIRLLVLLLGIPNNTGTTKFMVD